MKKKYKWINKKSGQAVNPVVWRKLVEKYEKKGFNEHNLSPGANVFRLKNQNSTQDSLITLNKLACWPLVFQRVEHVHACAEGRFEWSLANTSSARPVALHMQYACVFVWVCVYIQRPWLSLFRSFSCLCISLPRLQASGICWGLYRHRRAGGTFYLFIVRNYHSA